MSAIQATVTLDSSVRKCTDPKAERYALGCALLTPLKDGRAAVTATNGRVLGVVQTDGWTDDGREHLIPADVLPTRKDASKVTLNGRWESSERRFSDPKPMDSETRFPRTHAIVGDVPDNAIALRVNAEQIRQLAAMLSYDGELTLFIDPAANDYGFVENAILAVGSRGFGATMPLTGNRPHGEPCLTAAGERDNFNFSAREYFRAREAASKRPTKETAAPTAAVPPFDVPAVPEQPAAAKPSRKPEPVESLASDGRPTSRLSAAVFV